MHRYEFEPSDEPMDNEHFKSLVRKKVLPIAILALRDKKTGLAYSVFNRRQERGSGLPTVHLDRLPQRAKLGGFVVNNIQKRFRMPLELKEVHVLPFISERSGCIDDLRAATPGLHQLVYIPVIGRTEAVPDNNHGDMLQLRLLTDNAIMANISSYGGEEILRQSIDLHRELLNISRR